jgi:predicted transcriptional regulator of viral defense system
MEKVHSSIMTSISRKKQGTILFVTDFRGLGTEAAIRKALSRLVSEDKLKRLAHGIYYIPKIDPVLGEIRPAAEDVAKMIARKEGVRIRPAGAYALHRLGLTTQVPTRLVYITDGPPRQFKVGKMQVKFRATSHKKLSTIGKISGLVIQALEELNINNIDQSIETKIRDLLLKEDKGKLRHDLTLASIPIHDYIVKLLKTQQQENDRMVEAHQ